MNNSMSNVQLILVEHVIALLVLNIVGLICLWLTVYLINKKTPNPKTKLVTSIKMGLGMLIILAIISGNLGVYLWVESGNFQAAILAIPLFICGSMFIFPVVTIGTYVQLIYQDKMQEYVDSHRQ